MEPGGRQAEVQDRRRGGRAVGEARVDARQGAAHLDQPRQPGPPDRVVLAGGERNVAASGLARRPPGSEHMPVDQVGVGEPRAEPAHEAPVARVLEVLAAAAPDLELELGVA